MFTTDIVLSYISNNGQFPLGHKHAASPTCMGEGTGKLLTESYSMPTKFSIYRGLHCNTNPMEESYTGLNVNRRVRYAGFFSLYMQIIM